MTEVPFDRNFEFLRPLVSGWQASIEAADNARAKWNEVVEECRMFYSRSAAAMWDPAYTKKFWRGVKSPKFRISINKAFEYVAIIAPRLMWTTPHREVKPKRRLSKLDPEVLPEDETTRLVISGLGKAQDDADRAAVIRAALMYEWLNYTPNEQPGGGLFAHSERALIDALITGRGVMMPRPYVMPGSQRRLTGVFHVPPEDILIDPDARNLSEARWIAIRHREPYWEVERRFRLPDGSLKNRATLESAWQKSKLQTALDRSESRRAAELTNDLIVWDEIYSRKGPGARATSLDGRIRDYLEELIGDNAYIAVAHNVPYPLNCPRELLLKGATSEEVRERFQWPIPLHEDERWPVEFLDFYIDPESVWPIPPLAPALGELKFLNFIIPWLANRIWSSSRDFWSVLGPHVEHYQKYLEEGLDQTVVPTPAMVDDVRKAIQVLQQPETRLDVWRIVELVSDLFDKRVGLPEPMYGRNEGGTQDRAAAVTIARQNAISIRPNFMQSKVAEFQSRLAQLEGLVTGLFIRANDVLPSLGPVGAYLWEQYIEPVPQEHLLREIEYTVAASSLRPPDREREISEFQTFMQSFFPLAQQAYLRGDVRPANFLIAKFGELHNLDVQGAFLQAPEPPPNAPRPEGAMPPPPQPSKAEEPADDSAAALLMGDVLPPDELTAEEGAYGL